MATLTLSVFLLAPWLPIGWSPASAPAAMAQQRSAPTIEPTGGPCITVASAPSLRTGQKFFLSFFLLLLKKKKEKKSKKITPSPPLTPPHCVTRYGSKGKGLKIILALAVMDSSSVGRGGKGSLHWGRGCHTGEITLINQTNYLLAG